MLQELAVAHLRLGLQSLNAVLRRAVQAQCARAARLSRPDLTPYCISQEEAACLLEDAGALLADGVQTAVWAEPDAGALREAAARDGVTLPLDALTARFALSDFERLVVIVCAAAEVDRGYGRLFAFILDDASRQAPSVELLCQLSGGSLELQLARRQALSRFGTLRRHGVLVAQGEAGERQQEMRLAAGLFDHLAGNGSDLSLICGAALPAVVDATTAEPGLANLARSLGNGGIRIAGIWGARQSAVEAAAAALAAAAGLELCAWSGDEIAGLRLALQDASLGARLLWVPTDALAEPPARALGLAVIAELARGSARVVLTGAQPWRPPALLAASAYGEIELDPPDLAARTAMWRAEVPELAPEAAGEMAARLRFSHEEVRAVARMSRTAARRTADDDPCPHLPAAAAALSGGRCRQFATLVRPRRGPEDLILPAALHAQVLEVAQFYRAWPAVAEGWGFGRLATGAGGIKALFAGEPGTGKTLAAEVIAAVLQVPLLRVELSRVVSKWVGETEKNLDAAFAEAEDSQAVLLFDEADALFGRRGQVETGVDRYANLEVSHLLQRLDEFGGLALLASNLKDNIDPAFTRRFHAILHFPRPQPDERLRLWRLAFPPQAPLDGSIDFEALANLDLTGAGIVGAARAAALLAAQEGAAEIGKPHIVRAIARQFRREARLLTPKELGPYASLLQDAR